MYKTAVSKYIPFTILLIAIFSIQQFTSFPIGSTTIWWLIQAIILVLFFWEIFNSRVNPVDKKNIQFVKYYLIWNLITIIYGVFVAENYWDWKALIGNILKLLFPIIAYISLDKEKVQLILSFFIRYVLPASLLFFPFLYIGAWGWYLFPISFLMLFFPGLKLSWKIIILTITLIAAFADVSVRSFVIKYGIPIGLMLLFYLKSHSFINKFLVVGRHIFIVAPIVLFILAFSGIFNVFDMKEYIKGEHVQSADTEIEQEDLKADTRTGLYEEVIQSALKHNYWLIGRSPARGNDTELFDELSNITGRKERLTNEVAILNIFTWTGIIGVLLYFLIFYWASYLAIYHSNNFYSKLIGLFVAFRWLYAWVEDYQGFTTNNFVIWMMIGISISYSFRMMNDKEVKLWVRGIFERKYYLVYTKYRLTHNQL